PSIIAAAFFLFCPYRMFCALCRFALAEAVAISFLPVLFYGIYSLLHDEETKFRSFLAIIVGVCCLILSHPYTALISVIVALLYMAMKYKALWRLLKDKKAIILSAVTVLLIFGLIGFYFFPMLAATGSGQYRISDAEATWQTFEHVSGSTANDWQYTGFLNTSWIGRKIEEGVWPETDTPIFMVTGVVLLLVSGIMVAFVDHFVQKLPYSKFYRFPVDVLVSWLPIFFFAQRIEVYLGLTAFDVVFVLANLFLGKSEEEEGSFVRIEKEVLHDAAFLVLLILSFVFFIGVKDGWLLVPKSLYVGQFAWRLWSIVAFLVSWIFLLLVDWLSTKKNKVAFVALTILPFTMFAASQAYPEKRVALTYEGSTSVVYEEYGPEETMLSNGVGAMNEYIPIIFYDKTYESQYPNSLYSKVRSCLGNHNKFIFDKETYFTPVFLEKSGSAEVVELNTPHVRFLVSVDEDEALIQIPQFYYDGYVIDFLDKETEEVFQSVTPENVDSLVSFHADKGEYLIDVSYQGPVTRRVFNVVFFVSLAGLLGLSVLAGYELYKDKRKEYGEFFRQEEGTAAS
ncbi:MAG: hypothetical protein J5736_04765, partial [Bacilli bacterium]|nr:hypothetical protein [Bacilli bacterium]